MDDLYLVGQDRSYRVYRRVMTRKELRSIDGSVRYIASEESEEIKIPELEMAPDSTLPSSIFDQLSNLQLEAFIMIQEAIVTWDSGAFSDRFILKIAQDALRLRRDDVDLDTKMTAEIQRMKLIQSKKQAMVNQDWIDQEMYKYKRAQEEILKQAGVPDNHSYTKLMEQW